MSMMQALRREVIPFPRAFRDPAFSGGSSKRDVQMTIFRSNDGADDRIAAEAVACILRRLVDDGAISASAAHATMTDSLATLAEPGLRAAWEEATEQFATDAIAPTAIAA